MCRKRNHMSKMTAPDAALWGIREVPRPSLAAQANPRELLSVLLAEPSATEKEEPYASPPTPGSAAMPARLRAPHRDEAGSEARLAASAGGADRASAAPARHNPAPGTSAREDLTNPCSAPSIWSATRSSPWPSPPTSKSGTMSSGSGCGTRLPTMRASWDFPWWK